MMDVFRGLKALEAHSAKAAKEAATPQACLDLGVEARNLGAALGTLELPAGPAVREQALLLTHHGEELARAALHGREADAMRALVRELASDTRRLRGTLETADLDDPAS